MTSWAGTVFFVLVCVFLGALLKELGFRGAKFVVILGSVGVVGAAALGIGEISESLGAISPSGSEYAEAMLRILGVGYVFGVCSDVCLELGEGSMSSALSLLGRVEIFILSLPYVKMIIEKGIELI